MASSDSVGLLADFQIIETLHFTIRYASTLSNKTSWYDGPAPSWVPVYAHTTDPEAKEWFRYQPNIFMVTNGSVLIQNKKHPDFIFTKGQGTSMTRSKTIYKLTAIEDNTSWFCLIPKKNMIYQRSIMSLNSGDTISETNNQETFYFVATGKININTTDRQTFSLIKFGANEVVNLTALEDSYLIKIWE